MPYRVRDPEQVVAELLADEQPYAVFVDNNLGSRPDYLKALCRVLVPLEKIWSAAVTLDVTDDPALVREMALAGCTGVFIGFESLSDENLAVSRKRTPLFRRLEAEGRLLHRDWALYDTAHVVFRPRRLTETQLAEGYAWLYRRLFSHASIWRRRPEDWRAVAPCLAMSYLYKRSNRFWHLLIRSDLTHAVWRPLVELTRQRHVRFRRRLAARPVLPGACEGA